MPHARIHYAVDVAHSPLSPEVIEWIILGPSQHVADEIRARDLRPDWGWRSLARADNQWEHQYERARARNHNHFTSSIKRDADRGHRSFCSRADRHELRKVYFAAKHFDKDLRHLRRALLENKDGPRFEAAVCALLFLLGFAPAVQIQTEAPDLLVATPVGRLVLVECTLKVADFRTKLGKLVDRRSSLIREMERTGHTAQLYAISICRVPLDQLVYDPEELTQHDVILLSQPDIETGLSRVDAHNDPDSVLFAAVEVRAATAPGIYGDGGGIWLQVSKGGAKSWLSYTGSSVNVVAEIAKSRHL